MNQNIKTRLFLMICVICALMIGVQSAFAADAAPTGQCKNVQNEGIEYLVATTVEAEDAADWRSQLTVYAETSDGNSAGEIKGLELQVSGTSTRYQCTEIYGSADSTDFSCNSMPAGAIITGVYFLYTPSVDVDTDIKFFVNNAYGENLLTASGDVELPPYPCSVNAYEKDFLAANSNYALNTGESLIYNTSTECGDEEPVLHFAEQPSEFAIVNFLDSLNSDRIWLDVSPQVDYDYTLVLKFVTYKDLETYASAGDDASTGLNYLTVTYTYSAADPNNPTIVADSAWDVITLEEMPVYLIGGDFSDVVASKYDLWGNPDLPTSTDFEISFYYQNYNGTQGYENSIFHFTRDLNIQFAPYCRTNNDDTVYSGSATSLYDKCQSTKQLFSVDLTDATGSAIEVPSMDCDGKAYCTDAYNVYVEEEVPSSTTNYYFTTRKCADASCASMTTTSAYLYSLTVSDGDSLSRTYKNSGTSGKTTSLFKMKAYGTEDRPFAITGARLMVEEAGTYVVYGFVDKTAVDNNNDLSAYAVKFYVTVNDSESLGTCSTLANNGYFTAYWNDCLDYRLTQLLTFEHTKNKEEAWIENRSAHGVHFSYNSAYSYLPQNLEIASLKCTFTALSEGSGSGGYCNPEDIYVPAYTKVTITGGTAYLESSPTADEYRIAYMREETMNISHLFFSIPIKECDNVKKIPDTGISLRSPLTERPKAMRESIPEATNYVFTGNSIEIPAIGLGTETPIPIVHVYYQDGDGEKGWDLSTLGNYVGELEGGSYLPYAGNSALTGHYYSQGVFKNLEYLNIGDEIIIYGSDGYKYTYQVTEKFITQPTDVYEMFQQIGERSLTLVTCDNYNLVTDEYERRQLIRASIVSSEPYDMN